MAVRLNRHVASKHHGLARHRQGCSRDLSEMSEAPERAGSRVKEERQARIYFRLCNISEEEAACTD